MEGVHPPGRLQPMWHGYAVVRTGNRQEGPPSYEGPSRVLRTSDLNARL
jgi:hypothetical protein